MPQNPFEDFMRQQQASGNPFEDFVQEQAKPKPVKPTQPKTVKKVPTRGPVRPQGPAPTFNVNPLQSMLGVAEPEQAKPTVPGSVKPKKDIPQRSAVEQVLDETPEWQRKAAIFMAEPGADKYRREAPPIRGSYEIGPVLDRRPMPKADSLEDAKNRILGQIGRGVRNFPESATRVIESLSNIGGDAALLADPEYQAMTPEQQVKTRKAVAQFRQKNNLGDKVAPLTQRLSAKSEAMYPTNPASKGFLTKDIPDTLGSVADFAVGGAGARAFGVGQKLAAGGLGMSLSVDSFKREAAEAGIDPERIDRGILMAGASGITEIFGVGRMLDRFGMSEAKRPILRHLFDVLEEGGQENVQGVLEDINAAFNAAYDPERKSVDPRNFEFWLTRGKEFALGTIGGAAVAGPSLAVQGLRGRSDRKAAEAVAAEQPAPLNLTASRPGGTPTTVIPLNPTPEQAAQFEQAAGAINQSAARTAAEAKADEILSLPDDDAKRQALKDAEDDPLLNEVLYQRVNQEIADIQADPSLTSAQKAQQVANARAALMAEGIDLYPNVPPAPTPIQDRLAARPGGPVEATPVERPLTPEQRTAEVLNRQLGDEQIQVEQAKAQLARQREAQRQQSIAQAEALNRQLAKETEVERVTRENEQAFDAGFAEALEYEKQARDLSAMADWNNALVALAEQKGTLTALWSNLPREMKTPARKRQIDGELERIRQNRSELLRAQKNPRARQEGSFAPQFLMGEQKAAAPTETGEAFPDLLQTVRRLGGVKTNGTYGGEIAGVLSNKESGTSGIVNNKSGMDLDYMREALVGEGAIPPETTNSELLEMLDMAVRNKDRERPTGTIDEQLVAHIEEQARQTAEGSANPFEEFMQGEAEADTADWTARNAAATQASEDRRPPMGLGPERPDAAKSDVSYSPYNDLVTNNRELVDQLYNMPLDDAEAVSTALEEGLGKLQEYADRRGIERRHVDALENYIRSHHFDRARNRKDYQSDSEYLDWLQNEAEAELARFKEEEIAAFRERFNALLQDETAITLFNRGRTGSDFEEFGAYANEKHGLNKRAITEAAREYAEKEKLAESELGSTAGAVPESTEENRYQRAVKQAAQEELDTPVTETGVMGPGGRRDASGQVNKTSSYRKRMYSTLGGSTFYPDTVEIEIDGEKITVKGEDVMKELGYKRPATTPSGMKNRSYYPDKKTEPYVPAKSKEEYEAEREAKIKQFNERSMAEAKAKSSATITAVLGGRYTIKTGRFNSLFVQELKRSIPARGRAWDPDARVWNVDGQYIDKAREITRKYYGYVSDAKAEGSPEVEGGVVAVEKAAPKTEAAGKATASESATKEPWQMTRKEFTQSRGADADIESDEFANYHLSRIETGSPGLSVEGDKIIYRNDSGEPVGVTTLKIAGGERVVDDTAVRSDFRRQGIATKLYQEAMRRGHLTGWVENRASAAVKHKMAVEQALSEGKPVPAEVLADYPDLKPKKNESLKMRVPQPPNYRPVNFDKKTRADVENSPEFKQWSRGAEVVKDAATYAFKTGKAVVVRAFHGTKFDFDSFSTLFGGRNTEAPSARRAFFFTADAETAADYASIGDGRTAALLKEKADRLERAAQRSGKRSDWTAYENAYAAYEDASLSQDFVGDYVEGTNVIPAYVVMQNPLVRDFGGERYREESFYDLLEDARKSGHDGVIFTNVYDPGKESNAKPINVFATFKNTNIKSATGNRGTFDPNEASILKFREGKRIDRTVTTPSGRKRSAKTPEFLTKGEIPPDAQGENYNKVYENIGGEFAQKRREGVPGTLYLNDHAAWVLDEVELSMMQGMPGYENLKPHAYGGATVLLNDAQQMADILRDRAENLWADRPDIQENINGLADLIEEAITDARANGEQNSIEIVNASKDYSEILPEEYKSYLDSQKKSRRHESAHIWQTKIDPNRPGLLTNSETADDVYYEKIRDALYNYYPNITHDQVYSEAFAFIASGDWMRAGLTKEEAAKWLNYYFTKIAKKYGRAALAAGPKRLHPMTKGILTDVSERTSERTRRDQGANGRGAEAAPRESLKIRRPERSMGQRQDAAGTGGRDTGSAGRDRSGEGRRESGERVIAPRAPKAPEDPTIAAIQAAKEAEREKKARPSAKPIRVVGELYHASRTILASSDLSALRQGMFMSLPPTQWPKAWKAMRTMFGSLKRSNYDGFKAGLEAHPDYNAAQEAGLFFATADADKMTDREEAFISEWASNLPIVKQSEQAFKSYLDSLRIDTFAKYKRALDSRLAAGAITDVQYGQALREAAYWINTSTGRGSVRGKVGDMVNTAMPVASAAFFAPRYLISRFQLLNPITYGRNVTDAGKRVIFRNQMAEMFQSAAVLTAIGYGASLLGATVNWDDPDDPDWLKIKFGNTRFDALAGVQQVARLAYNIGNWLKTEATEEDLKALRDMRGSTKNHLLTFGRTKLAPVPSFFVDWINDWKNVIGEQRKPFEFLKKEGASAKLEEASKDPIISRYLPLLWSDMVEAYVRGYREGGATVGAKQAAKFSPAIFGIGVQDYERKPNILSVGETSAPLAESLQKLGLKFESVRSMPGESPEQLRERAQKINVWMDAYGEALVKNPRFKKLTPEQQKAAIENLRGRVGGEANRKTPRLSRFNAASVIAGTLKGAEQKRKRAAGNIYNPPE